ncbi:MULTISPECIES: type II toxin-antitoxin system VapC family toxin [unclassified Synechococcus]|uniref:type II toxin-antitoxin system VapC family toxin n=1 Tax=unclassified Synechococcus TaxID=2626047 RepID=UPI0020CEA012|nr:MULTISPECIES: type II toxin-antitoxin system VapC family toxin [unclassified Synechococcus]
MAAANGRLMLDTNAVNAFLKGLSPRLDTWVREQRCSLSSIVVAEIRYGLEKLPPTSRLQALVENTLKTLEILPWSEACARVYGRLRADLDRNGKPLAAMDLLIASHALSEGCALVTADQAFANVADLHLESW